MEKIFVTSDEGIPQFVCTGCSQCSSLMGESLCEVINRGCCSYFPKFNLYDIHRMSLTLEGLNTLERIKSQDNTTIHDWHIHAKGFFDQYSYNKYLQSGNLINTDDIKDHSIFFKACPFVKPGYGCTLAPKFRTYVCNFFICREILDSIQPQELFNPYIDERKRYVSWVEWEVSGLKQLLSEQNLTLAKNFDECIRILQGIPLNSYEFAVLPPIELPDKTLKGA